MFSFVTFSLVSALAVSAADISINVGANGTLAYNPPFVQAQPGDSIHFLFEGLNHTATQSTFADPCTPMANGSDSGFMPVDPNVTVFPMWTFNVTDTTPLWFYCKQTNPAPHCGKGMVFAVNPTGDKNFTAFQQKANATAGDSNGAGPGAMDQPDGAMSLGAVSAVSLVSLFAAVTNFAL